MSWWRRLLGGDESERRLDSELRFHLERQVEDLVRNGMTPAEARRRARLDFGGLEPIKEACRDAGGLRWVENAIADIRFSARGLRRNPAFTVVAAATLALGIGANTAIFGVLNAVFLRPLPYPQPERLAWATEYFPRFKRDRVFTPEYAAWRGQNTAFEHLEACGFGLGATLTAGDRAAERVPVGHVTPGFFAMLGVQPQLGRTFLPEEQPESRIAILGDALWRGSFNRDPAVLQTPVSLNGTPYTVIGVMPAGFIDPCAADTGIWLPDAVDAKRSIPGRSMGLLAGVIGRLKPGATVEAARANLEVIARRMDSRYPVPWSTYHSAASVRVLPLQKHLAADSRTVIAVLMGAAGFILLIVCANLANLCLSRAVVREKEIALRCAIGASRSRVVRLLLTESLLIGASGGLAGTVLTAAGIPLLRFLMPATIPPHIPIDARVLGFAALCSAAAGLLFGLAPALAASRIDLNSRLKEDPASPVRHGRRAWFGGALTAAQMALSLVLLAGAGLLLRSFVALTSVDPGFNPRHVLLASVSLAPRELYGPARQAQFFGQALDAIQRIPGVQYAAVTDQGPLTTFQTLASGLAAEGQPENDATVVPMSVSAGYFSALQIPLREGRFFNPDDGAGTRRVAIINETLARLLFPGGGAPGRRIRYGSGKDPWVTVVGMVADVRHRGLDDTVWPMLYQPYQQAPSAWMSFVIKTSADPSGWIPAVRKAVRAVDRSQPLFEVQPLEERLSGSVAQRRHRTFLLGSFALLALAVAVIGVYGVTAYSAARRTREIGIRMALGAAPRNIVREVAGQAAGTALVGIALGLLGTRALAGLLSSFLYGVTATDAATYAAVCLLLLSAACLAAYIPARRATRIDPMTVLRH